MIYLKVSIPILLYKTFIYSSNHNPDTLFLGQGVKVKFNNRITSGYIISTSDKTSYKGKINPIIDINENSANISQELLDTINWSFSSQNITPPGKFSIASDKRFLSRSCSIMSVTLVITVKI